MHLIRGLLTRGILALSMAGVLGPVSAQQVELEGPERDYELEEWIRRGRA